MILGEVIKKSIERTLEPRAGTLTLRSCGDSKVPAKKPGKEVQDRQEETEGRSQSGNGILERDGRSRSRSAESRVKARLGKTLSKEGWDVAQWYYFCPAWVSP